MSARVNTTPIDVRFMNALAALLMVGVLGCLLFGLATWVARLPIFALAGITVTGEVQHTNAVTLKANIVPRLTGSFFTVDLQKTREIFQEMPWTRRAVVEREFPNRLRIHIEEHRPVAFWGAQGDERLLNSPLGLAGQRCMGTLVLGQGSPLLEGQRRLALDVARQV